MKIQMPNSAAIKREIAARMVEQSDPGYAAEYRGEYYVVDTDGDGFFDSVMHKDPTAQWDPWHVEGVAVAVADLYIDSICNFDPTPDDEFLGDMDPDFDPAYDEAEEAAIDMALAELPSEIEVEIRP